MPFQAGGTTDLLARLLAEGLGSRLGQPVLAENRGGAGGAVGAEIAARMEPDGHNLFFATIGSAAIIPQMHARLNWRPANLVCRRRRESRPMERRHGGAAGGVKSGHW